MNKVKTVLFAALLISAASMIVAEEKKYGSFVYNSEMPNALFFMEEIKSGDNFELRKALRNHDIDTIILASPGGSVWAGLSMAGIIFDKKLRVLVPKDGVCASACSFMFFGGRERLNEGKLGVHQFSSANKSETSSAANTQAQSQFTASEIIGFLNEFETPRFVLERMFQDVEMYWFDPKETEQLNSENFTLEPANQSIIYEYATKKMKATRTVEVETPKYSEKELILLIQKRLNKIGCSVGTADGIWGRRSNAAAVQFATKVGLSTSNGSLISEKFLAALSVAAEGTCPKPKAKVVVSTPSVSRPNQILTHWRFTCHGGKGAMNVPIFARVKKYDPRTGYVSAILRDRDGFEDPISWTISNGRISLFGVSARMNKSFTYFKLKVPDCPAGFEGVGLK